MFLPPPPEVSKIVKKILTEDEKLLKLKLEQSAMIIAEVIKDKSILKELNQQIGKKLSITKNEEALTFKELFAKPENRKTESNNSKNQKIFTMDISIANHFKDRYLDIATKKNYPHSDKFEVLNKSFSNKAIERAYFENDMYSIDGAELYFPYSENYTGENSPYQDFTVSSAPIDNSQENYGLIWNDVDNNWDDVLVNDDYAYNHPSLLVTIDDGPTETDISTRTLGGTPADYRPAIFLDNLSSTPPPFLNPTPTIGSRVYFGKLHLEKFAEGLFDGASEIVLIRPSITASLDANGNLNTANVSIEQSIPLDKIRRNEIRKMENNKQRTVWVGGTFSNEWKPINANLPLVIYEYDKGGKFEITLPTVKFKVKILGQDVDVTTPGSFKYQIESKSNAYLIEDVSRAFYGTHKNIANPGIDPGQYDTWRSWGFQATSVTLITENTWAPN